MDNVLSLKTLDKVAIIGVGLLGGSVGLALRAAGAGAQRVGIGRRRSSLNRALAYDAIDEATLSFAKGLRGAQLAVVAVPLGSFPAIFGKMAPHLEPECIVTDVGSTKAYVVRLARRILPAHARFVGSHPIAGSEKTGVEFARADLFDRAVCIVTPCPGSDESDTQAVVQFWEQLGGCVRTLSPAAHDEVMARVSHLPHAIASALVNLATTDRAINAAGTGFQDVTRVASGDPGLWLDIFLTNRRAVLSAIHAFQRELRRFRRHLAATDKRALMDLLAKAKTGRDEWIQAKYAQREISP